MLPGSLVERHYAHQRPGKGTGAQSGEKGAALVPVLWNERGPFLA